MRTDGAYDAVIIGAGLVGLALAVAVRRAGFTVAVVDRANVAATEPGGADEDWDARVYAMSPGSAEFLRALGAWQRLPAERIARSKRWTSPATPAAESTFSAYELGERALAWIVENRELNAALVETLRTTDAIDVFAPGEPPRIAWQPDRPSLRSPTDARSPHGSSSAPTACGRGRARRPALRSEPRAYEQTAIVANFTPSEAHRGCAFQWFLADEGVLAWLPLPGRGISIVWSAPEALARELLALVGRCARGARRARPAGTRWAISRSSPRRRAFPCPFCGCRRPSRTGSRSSATRRTACIRSRVRASISASAMRRRSPRCSRRRGAIARRGRVRVCSSATRASAPCRCGRCRRSPTDLVRLVRYASPGRSSCAIPG